MQLSVVPEQRLWQRVLLYTLTDLWHKKTRRDALNFVFYDEGFSSICFFAGVNPSWFRIRCAELVRQNRTMPTLLRDVNNFRMGNPDGETEEF